MATEEVYCTTGPDHRSAIQQRAALRMSRRYHGNIVPIAPRVTDEHGCSSRLGNSAFSDCFRSRHSIERSSGIVRVALGRGKS